MTAPSRMSANLAELQALARPFGLSCVLEFFPWTNVPNLAAARAAVERTGAEDVGILIDTLHFDRSGRSLADLVALPPQRLPFLHLCDAAVHPPYTTEDLLHAGRSERLASGEGHINLAPILSRLPVNLPIALEVPMTGLATHRGCLLVASRVLDAARTCLAVSGRI